MKAVPGQTGINIIPKISPLFIDKISIMMGIAEQHMKQTSDNCGTLATNSEATIHKNNPLYKNAVSIQLQDQIGNDSPLLIQWEPRLPTDPTTAKIPTIKYLRLEWNPAKLSADIIKSVLNLNNILPEGFDSLVKKGTITRVDLTVDIKHINPGKLLFYYPGIQCSRNYLKSGKIQTAYLGTKQSEKMFVIYDKKAQLIKKNGKLLNKYPVPKTDLTRVELQLRPEEQMSFKKLLTMKNPFAALELTASKKPTPGKKAKYVASSDEYRLFQRVCIWEGVNQSLYFFSGTEKKKLYKQQIMSEGLNTFWNPDLVWQGLPAALEMTGFEIGKIATASSK